MKGFKSNIEKDTLGNSNFRRVVYTGKHTQLVLMSLKSGEEIGEEVHKTVDQFFRFEKGEGIVSIDGVKHKVADGDAVIVPAGARHNVTNTSKTTELSCTRYTRHRNTKTARYARRKRKHWRNQKNSMVKLLNSSFFFFLRVVQILSARLLQPTMVRLSAFWMGVLRVLSRDSRGR